MGRKSKFTLEERVSMCKDYLEMDEEFYKFLKFFSYPIFYFIF